MEASIQAPGSVRARNNEPYSQRELDEMDNAALLALYKEHGCDEARWTLVLRYTGLLQRVAMQTCGLFQGFAQTDDVIQEGILVLLNAVDKFDPQRGVKFETYIAKRLRGMVVDLARKQDWIPRQVRQKAVRLNRASEEASVKSEIAAQIAARNAHAANDNMMAGFDDPYDNYYDLQQEAASIPSALLEGYTRQLSGGKINAKLEAAIKSGQIKLPSSNTKSEAKKQPKVNKDSLTAMTVVAAGAALATGASLNKKRKNKVAKKLEDNE